jgi:hypothetical protein
MTLAAHLQSNVPRYHNKFLIHQKAESVLQRKGFSVDAQPLENFFPGYSLDGPVVNLFIVDDSLGPMPFSTELDRWLSMESSVRLKQSNYLGFIENIVYTIEGFRRAGFTRVKVPLSSYLLIISTQSFLLRNWSLQSFLCLPFLIHQRWIRTGITLEHFRSWIEAHLWTPLTRGFLPFVRPSKGEWSFATPLPRQ